MILETRLLLVNKPKKRQLTSNTYPSVIVFAFWNVNEFHFKEQQNALGSSLEKILPCLVFVVQTWHRGLTSESNDFAALKNNWNRLTQLVRICYETYFLCVSYTLSSQHRYLEGILKAPGTGNTIIIYF